MDGRTRERESQGKKKKKRADIISPPHRRRHASSSAARARNKSDIFIYLEKKEEEGHPENERTGRSFGGSFAGVIIRQTQNKNNFFWELVFNRP
jgi:hypothetical protein